MNIRKTTRRRISSNFLWHQWKIPQKKTVVRRFLSHDGNTPRHGTRCFVNKQENVTQSCLLCLDRLSRNWRVARRKINQNVALETLPGIPRKSIKYVSFGDVAITLQCYSVRPMFIVQVLTWIQQIERTLSPFLRKHPSFERLHTR